ncbi:MAG TPA: hypothetical protein VGB03_07480 [Acidimicrobiales bacterium]|jgi:hypothetical protein
MISERTCRAVLLSLLCLWVAAFGALPAAGAQATATGELSPTTGPAGTTVTATGAGWRPGPVQVSFAGVDIVITTAGEDGRFSTTFTVPPDTPAGPQAVAFRGLDTSLVAVFTVPGDASATGGSDTPAPAQADETGSEVDEDTGEAEDEGVAVPVAAGIGAGAFVVGVVVGRLSKRRRRG